MLAQVGGLRGGRGGGRLLLGVSHHPVLALVILLVLAALAVYLSKRR